MKSKSSRSRIPWGFAIGLVTAVLLLLYQFGFRWKDTSDSIDPFVVMLEEIEHGYNIEYWVGVQDLSNENSVARYIATLCWESDHALKLKAGNDVPMPRRIYHVYVSPTPGRQHIWNVEADEPNYRFNCVDGEITLVSRHEGLYRDENNRLMPAGWRPPRPEPEPWYVDALKVAVGAIVLFVLLAAAAIYGRGNTAAQSEGPSGDDGKSES